MQIGVIGLNHKQAPVVLREALAKVCKRRFSFSDYPFVLLTTCNRTEIYFCSADLAETQSEIHNILKNELAFEIGQELYSFFGQDCFYHLAKVTSGLDSALLLETEIQGQVKSCYQQAHQTRSLPFELHYLFQKALKIGKDIRTNLHLPKAFIDIEHAVLRFGEHLSNPSILFIGASKTNLKIAQFLKKKNYRGISLINRTDATSLQACKVEGYRYLEWSEKASWIQFDWVIAATKADHYQLLRKDADHTIRTQLCIDLSVPRNIDPALSDIVPLINIDQINGHLENYSSILTQKRAEIEQSLEELAERYTSLFHQKSEKLYVFA